ncbi:MAG: CBM35 domain-containing protein [Bacteroidota bacterium]
MNNIYKKIPILVLTGMLFATTYVAGQDTLTVEWLDGEGNLLENSLFNTIVGDTVAGGERANPNRVYRLRQGGFYYVEERIENQGWHLNIWGEPGDPGDEFANPPMIQLDPRADATTADKILTAGGDVTIKNVIINGKATNGNLQYEVLRSDGVDARLTFDNVIFEFAQWGIMGVYGRDSKLYVTNSRFRNFLSETQPWGGRGMSVWADVDTLFFENNSFVNIGGFGIQIEAGSPEFTWINHNTFANVGRQMLLGAWVQEAYITNNLILNGFWHGEARSEISDDRLEPGSLEEFAGMFAIESLPAQYGLDLQRKIAISNNSFFLESEYETYFTTDNDTFNIRKQPLLNDESQALFDANANMVVANNLFDTQDPGFTVYPDNSQDGINFITDVRQGNAPIRLYYWSGSNRDFSDHFSIEWPLSEDLTYSNNTLQGAAIGGYPLGDLNWYPNDKANWEANRSAQRDQIFDLLGDDVEVTFAGSSEGEAGTLGSGASVVETTDKQAFRVTGSDASATWSFNIDTEDMYDVVVRMRTWYDDTNPGRQTNVDINGSVSTVEYGVNGPEWSDVVIEDQTLTAGSNTISVIKNWGFMEYESVTVLDQSGNVVEVLNASKATLDGGGFSLECTGDFCTSGDEYALLPSGGTAMYTFNSEGTGNYVIRVNHFTVDGEATVSVSVNGVAIATEPASSDSSIAELNITDVILEQGNNDIEISSTGGDLAIDNLSFFVIGDLTGVSTEEEFGPETFALSQNYPNPFNPTTNINFTIPAAGEVELTVFNLLGQRVETILDTRLAAGTYTATFNASHLASGVYLYRLSIGSQVINRRMTLIK